MMTPMSLIPHIKQKYSWDCGIACCLMILQALNLPQLPIPDFNEHYSPWTIDLAEILLRMKVRDFTYFTSYVGIKWDHSHSLFYRDHLQEDQKRIHRLFAEAKDKGIRVIYIVLPLEDIKRFLLSGNYAIIILVDLSSLKCKRCSKERGLCGFPFFCLPKRIPAKPCQDKHSRKTFYEPTIRTPQSHDSLKQLVSSQQMQVIDLEKQPYQPPSHLKWPCLKTKNTQKRTLHPPSFEGHYILLIDYDLDHDHFIARDPGCDEEYCLISSQVLDESRSANGTDHDIIIVSIKSANHNS